MEESCYALATIANNVYYIDSGASDMGASKCNAGLAGDYKIIADSIRDVTGQCAMAVFKSETKKVLAIKGTSARGSDIANDIAMVLGGANSILAVQPTLTAARELIRKFGANMVTGHSLGGYIAEIIGTNDRIPGISFCGPGVNGPVVKLGGNEMKGFQNINFEHDALGNVNCAIYTHVQWSVYVEGTTHSIETMVAYFSNKRHINNRNVVSKSSSYPTGYYYPK